MKKFIIPMAVFVGILVGSTFLSGAGVGYNGWYSLPAPASNVVVSIATLYAFAKLSIFIVSIFTKK
ncbi:hypothetical protein [Mixta theicola]|nr:hypothetical protein [Mixta theicola]GLR09678.1 hypothetical protein GCM10007905_23980 [Mixta theicola]